MRSPELADAVEELIRECRGRVLGVGDEQYSQGDMQKFETMPLEQLKAWTDEEIDDVVVYMAMVKVRVTRLFGVLKVRGLL